MRPNQSTIMGPRLRALSEKSNDGSRRAQISQTLELHLRAALMFTVMLTSTLPAEAQRTAFSRTAHPWFTVESIRTIGGHGRLGPRRARVAFYIILTIAAVTDPAIVRATTGRLDASLASTSGRVLVTADNPVTVVGSGPAYINVMVFDDVWSAQAWQRSDAVKSILASLGRAGTVTVMTAGGLADPGARPSVQVGAKELGMTARIPAMPTIVDICKGC